MPHKSLGRSLAREDAPIARAVGQRIREERHRAGLTQQQLADDRYTKAYISALENGLAKPSLAALTFIAGRLGRTAAYFLREGEASWSRVEADLHLASGDWERAVDDYTTLLETETQAVSRAELERALAEALVRLDRPDEAIPVAARSAAAFEAAGRSADGAISRYWEAAAQSQLENDAAADSILQALLDAARGGLAVEPELEARVLVALARIAGRGPERKKAVAYLAGARAVLERFDPRRRASYLASLAIGCRDRGDTEAALRLANQAVARLRELEADRDVALLEHEIALSQLAAGATRRARRHAATADAIVTRLGDDRTRAEVLETRARVELAGGDAVAAVRLAEQAASLADESANRKVAISARLTLGRARRASGDTNGATAAFAAAVTLARRHDRLPELRRVLTEWAELRSELGDAAGASTLSREALDLARA